MITVRVLKAIIHNARHVSPGEILPLEEHLVDRLVNGGFVTTNIDKAPEKPAQTQEAAAQQPAPDSEIEDENKTNTPGDIEEGGSEDKDEDENKDEKKGKGLVDKMFGRGKKGSDAQAAQAQAAVQSAQQQAQQTQTEQPAASQSETPAQQTTPEAPANTDAPAAPADNAGEKTE